MKLNALPDAALTARLAGAMRNSDASTIRDALRQSGDVAGLSAADATRLRALLTTAPDLFSQVLADAERMAGLMVGKGGDGTASGASHVTEKAGKTPSKMGALFVARMGKGLESMLPSGFLSRVAQQLLGETLTALLAGVLKARDQAGPKSRDEASSQKGVVDEAWNRLQASDVETRRATDEQRVPKGAVRHPYPEISSDYALEGARLFELAKKTHQAQAVIYSGLWLVARPDSKSADEVVSEWLQARSSKGQPPPLASQGLAELKAKVDADVVRLDVEAENARPPRTLAKMVADAGVDAPDHIFRIGYGLKNQAEMELLLRHGLRLPDGDMVLRNVKGALDHGGNLIAPGTEALWRAALTKVSGEA